MNINIQAHIIKRASQILCKQVNSGNTLVRTAVRNNGSIIEWIYRMETSSRLSTTTTIQLAYVSHQPQASAYTATMKSFSSNATPTVRPTTYL